MEQLKMCRACKVRDIDVKNGNNWIMPSKGFYYHIDCYEKKKKKDNQRKCVYCKKFFDISEGYKMPRVNTYAHIECYEKNYSPDEEYIDLIYKLLKEEIGMTYDYGVCERQRKHFIDKLGYTNEGIYNALKYHYIVKNGSIEKSGNRIGIVSYVYNEAQQYYKDLNKRQKAASKKLDQQLKEKDKVIQVENLPKRDKRKLIDIDEIGVVN